MVTPERIERTALKNLIHNEEYTRKVLPFLKAEYFDDRNEKIIFSEIEKFISQYNKPPTKETLEIDIGKRKDLNEKEYQNIVDLISTLSKEDIDLDRFKGVGVIKNEAIFDNNSLDQFENEMRTLTNNGNWSKKDILDLFFLLLPDFSHKETGKYLDQRM